MARAPFNVLVFPYHALSDLEFEYALLRRADCGYWHVVSGGGENDETPLDAARRETCEETGISETAQFLPLDTIMPVPVTEYSDSYLWGEDVFVIPQYCFGVLAESDQIVLSPEHIEYRWTKYDQARQLLKYESSRIALWELDRRVRGVGPRDTSP